MKTTENALSKNAQAAFSGDFNVKYLATADADGIPNIVPVISIIPLDEKHLIFGQLMIQKTRRNLDAGNHKVGFMVVDTELRVWTGTGDFLGFEEAGPNMERLNSLSWIRYNAYTGFKAAGRIAVREVRPLGAFSKLDMLMDQILMPGEAAQRRALDKGPVPPGVMEKFRRVKAVKALAYMDADGYPRVMPAVGVGFPGLFRVRVKLMAPGLDAPLEPDTPIALAVITMDPIAYQLKAEVVSRNRSRRTLDAAIMTAYSASPPLPGEDLTAVRLAEG